MPEVKALCECTFKYKRKRDRIAGQDTKFMIMILTGTIVVFTTLIPTVSSLFNLPLLSCYDEEGDSELI
ncbi:hypothetical protein D9758_012665 [Tetrapyrgos nigripes]|uniref:Uncharacterized protein n=1 Tax=Tetrapyrgos nigripes TaxID=182062 RepID=A0A8H5GDQ6_9AGAR|nr:hypothetical protein D9758_012665 [Tetrapyrgos nigripes]